jgi:hypothetical protein
VGCLSNTIGLNLNPDPSLAAGVCWVVVDTKSSEVLDSVALVASGSVDLPLFSSWKDLSSESPSSLQKKS